MIYLPVGRPLPRPVSDVVVVHRPIKQESLGRSV